MVRKLLDRHLELERSERFEGPGLVACCPHSRHDRWFRFCCKSSRAARLLLHGSECVRRETQKTSMDLPMDRLLFGASSINTSCARSARLWLCVTFPYSRDVKIASRSPSLRTAFCASAIAWKFTEAPMPIIDEGWHELIGRIDRRDPLGRASELRMAFAGS